MIIILGAILFIAATISGIFFGWMAAKESVSEQIILAGSADAHTYTQHANQRRSAIGLAIITLLFIIAGMVTTIAH